MGVSFILYTTDTILKKNISKLEIIKNNIIISTKKRRRNNIYYKDRSASIYFCSCSCCVHDHFVMFILI